jgi:hypothetical protein
MCDTCGSSLHNDEGLEWREFWKAAKDRGWTTRKVENKFNNWIHACPTCDLIEPPSQGAGRQGASG